MTPGLKRGSGRHVTDSRCADLNLFRSSLTSEARIGRKHRPKARTGNAACSPHNQLLQTVRLGLSSAAFHDGKRERPSSVNAVF